MICLGFSGLVYAADELAEAEKTFMDIRPKIYILANNYPNDIQIQLGAALLVNNPPIAAPYASVEDAKNARNAEVEVGVYEYKNVFKIDTGNKVASMLKAEKVGFGYVSDRRLLVEHLKDLVAIAKERGKKELNLEFPGNDPVCAIFDGNDKGIARYKAEVGKERYIYVNKIIDFNEAMQSLIDKLDKQKTSVLEEIAMYERNDPNNAFYNYLKAAVFFAAEEYDKGLAELENGSHKTFTTYYNQQRSAMAVVVNDVNFPSPQKDFILNTRGLSPMYEDIWKNGLLALAKESEDAGDLKHAEKIYELAMKMASQVEEDFGYPFYLKKIITDRLNKVHQKMKE